MSSLIFTSVEMLSEVVSAEKTISAIEFQSGNSVLPFPHAVSINGIDHEDHEDHEQALGAAVWGMLKRNSFDPANIDSSPTRPFGILVNLRKDIGNVPYITPRWLKLSLADQYNQTIIDSIAAQRVFLEAAGMSSVQAVNSFYGVQVEIAGRNYFGTVSTHLGRSLSSILKYKSHDEAQIVSASYQKAATQAIQVYRQGNIVNGANRHFYQNDPNLGNVLLMYEEGTLKVVNYDLTNKEKTYTHRYSESIEEKVFRNFQKGARDAKIYFPADISELNSQSPIVEQYLSNSNIITVVQQGF
jgi:hypothetical protein